MLTNRRIANLAIDACLDSYYQYGIICGNGICIPLTATIQVDNSLARIYCNEDTGVLVFRGTDDPKDWIENLMIFPKGMHFVEPDTFTRPFLLNAKPAVHFGFYRAYEKIARGVQEAIAEFYEPTQDWIFAGHSLGGAMASIATFSIKLIESPSLVTFGAPKFGNQDACWLTSQSTNSIFRFRNGMDVVSCLPLLIPSWKHPCPDILLSGPNCSHPILSHDAENYRAGLSSYRLY